MNIEPEKQIKPELRELVVKDIKLHMQRTGMGLGQILTLYRISRSTYYSWFKSTGELISERKKRNRSDTALLPEEIEALKIFRTDYPDVGYKKLTWMMIDTNIVFLSESTAYRQLKRLNMLQMGGVMTFAEKEYKNKPKYVHHHWHTDLAYVKIGIVYYYLIMVLDGYSRFLLNWSLLTDMTEISVSLFIQETKEKYPYERPLLIMDNGSQFISKDFKNLLSEINIRPVHTRRNHPQTNGRIERMNDIVKSEAIRKKFPQTYAEGISVMEDYEYEYNYNRVHAGINYLRPADVFFGRREVMLKKRKNKILLAREKRIQYNNLKLKEFVS